MSTDIFMCRTEEVSGTYSLYITHVTFSKSKIHCDRFQICNENTKTHYQAKQFIILLFGCLCTQYTYLLYNRYYKCLPWGYVFINLLTICR